MGASLHISHLHTLISWHVCLQVRRITITNAHAHMTRFVLGIVEAPFYPGAIYMISLFYTRKESAARMAVFYTGNLLASSFAGLIAAGVFSGLDGKHGELSCIPIRYRIEMWQACRVGSGFFSYKGLSLVS